ncbi:MAG: hypothetical protein R6U19_06175 [Bacteroidales bacterium]
MKRIVIIFLTAFLLSGSSYAQPDTAQKKKDSTGEDTVFSGEVMVVGPHDPRIADAFKIRGNPQMESIDVKKEPVEYDIQSIRLPVSFELDPIRPARMKGDPLDKLYNNHMRIAMGTSTMPYLEYFYNTTRSRDHAFGIHLKHFSASGKIDKHPFPGFSDNLAELYYKKFFKNHKLTSEAKYERNVVHSYGIPREIYDTLNKDIERKDIRLMYHRISANANFKSDYPAFDKDKLHHEFNLSAYHFSDNKNTAELSTELSGNIHKQIKLLPSADEQVLGLKFRGNYMNNTRDTLQETNTGLVRITPYLNNSLNNVTLNVGINTYIESDSISSRVEFYPDLHLRMELINNIFVLKGGLTGKTSQDQIHRLTKENPFMYTASALRFRHKSSVIYAGLNASISKNINFSTHFQSSKTGNEPFFLRDTTTELANRFNVVYDTVRTIYIRAELEYQWQDNLEISLGGKYTEFSETRLSHPWNRPQVEGYLKGRYNLQEKIIFNAELFFVGSRKALGLKDDHFQARELDPFIDANLSVEYRYNKLLSGFLKFHNIGAKKYEKWSDYPSYGFQFMAGLTYSM